VSTLCLQTNWAQQFRSLKYNSKSWLGSEEAKERKYWILARTESLSFPAIHSTSRMYTVVSLVSFVDFSQLYRYKTPGCDVDRSTLFVLSAKKNISRRRVTWYSFSVISNCWTNPTRQRHKHSYEPRRKALKQRGVTGHPVDEVLDVYFRHVRNKGEEFVKSGEKDDADSRLVTTTCQCAMIYQSSSLCSGVLFPNTTKYSCNGMTVAKWRGRLNKRQRDKRAMQCSAVQEASRTLQWDAKLKPVLACCQQREWA
jgi:hypothetical protein